MTLKQLEYFLAIAENGSITKAANSLRISQPPLSLQLKGLEEELGCQLFIRDAQGHPPARARPRDHGQGKRNAAAHAVGQ